MRQYSTPTIKIKLKGQDVETAIAGTAYLSFGKMDTETNKITSLFDATYTVEKENGYNYLITTLTQEQTGQYGQNDSVYIQFKSKNGGTVLTSSIAQLKALPSIKSEAI